MEHNIYKSATELATLIRQGKTTSTEIVQDHLDQIKTHNHKINALISVFEEEALQEAARCDQEAAAGRFRGPLHGVPVTIKEQFWIKGKRSNMNTKRLKDFVAPEDAVVVERIRSSGAIILGQTNVPKNLTDYQISGELYPEGKNPYNLEYSPGGSTGGGAAALAAGFTSLELGGDMGGSIRNPANFCGLYGLKPTENTVPFHGNIPLPKNADTFIIHMAQAGPLARTVEDVELLWQILKGPHESDRNVPKIQWDTPQKEALTDYKIAWTDGWSNFDTSTQIRAAIQNFAGMLLEHGCRVEKAIPNESIHIDSLRVFAGLFPYLIAQGNPRLVRMLIKMEANSGIFKGMKHQFPQLYKPLKEGFKFNVNHYGHMLLQRSRLIQQWETFFKEYDFLICPAAFGPAYQRCKRGSKLTYDGTEMIYMQYVLPYVAPFNASGNPALAIPLGLGKEGLPIGIQIVGKYWSEPELLRFAKRIAPLTQGFIKPSGY